VAQACRDDDVGGKGWRLTTLPVRATWWLRQSRTSGYGAPTTSVGGAGASYRGRSTLPQLTMSLLLLPPAAFKESDPLAVALCEGAGPPIWVDPMLDELAASLVVSRSAGAQAFERPSTLTSASLEVQTFLADTYSPQRMVQLSFANAEAPGVDGEDRPPTSMLTRDRQPDDDDVSPSALAREFARHVSAPLKTPILKAPPRRRPRRSPCLVTIRRSMHLAAKCASRAPNATLQAQKVLCV